MSTINISDSPLSEDKPTKETTFTGLRREYLLSKIPEYIAAIKDGNGPGFLTGVVRGYNKRFPEDKFEHNVDPPEEWMKSVRDEDPVDELEVPRRRPAESKESWDTRCAAFMALEKRVGARTDQVRGFMRRKVLEEDQVHFYEQYNETWPAVMGNLIGQQPIKVGRARAAYNVWARDHKELVDKIVAEKQKEKEAGGERIRREDGKEQEVGKEEAKEQEKAAEEEGKEKEKDDGKNQSEGRDEGEDKREVQGERKAKFPVSVYQEVAKAEFQKLAPEEQEKWKQQAKDEHESRKSEAEARKRAGYPETPAGRQGAIERFPAWMLAIADEARKATGLHISVFAGGPVPSADGQLQVISVHAGRTMGTPGESFGTAYRDAIKNFVVPIFGEYLNNCFTADDCKAMSLNGAGPDLGTLYKKNGQVEVNTVEGGKADALVKDLVAARSGQNHQNHSETKALNAGDFDSTPSSSEQVSENQGTKALNSGDANSTPSTSDQASEKQVTKTLSAGDPNSTPSASTPTSGPNTATEKSLTTLPATASTSEPNTAGSECATPRTTATTSPKTDSALPHASSLCASGCESRADSGLPVHSASVPGSSKRGESDPPSSTKSPTRSGTNSAQPRLSAAAAARAAARARPIICARSGLNRKSGNGGHTKKSSSSAAGGGISQSQRLDEKEKPMGVTGRGGSVPSSLLDERARQTFKEAEADRARWAKQRKHRLTIPPVSPTASSDRRVRRRVSSFIEGLTNGTGTWSSPIAIGSSPVRSSARAPSPPSPIQIESSPSSRASSASPVQTRYVTPHPSSPSLPSGSPSPPSLSSSPARPSRVQPSSPTSPTPAFRRNIRGGESRMGGRGAGEGVELAKGKFKAENVDEDVGEVLELDTKASGKRKAVETLDEVRKRRRTKDGSTEEPTSPSSTSSVEEVSVHLSTPSSPVLASRRKKTVVERMTHVEIPIRRSTRARKSREVPASLSSHSRAPQARPSTSSLQRQGSSSTSRRSATPLNAGLGDGAPEYLRKVVEHCGRFCELEGGDMYRRVIELLVRFEVKQGYQAARNLTTAGRPRQVGAWIAVGRRAPFDARIADVGEFADAMEEWWCNCVPSWRYDNDTETLTRGRGQWECLRVSGANGLTSVVAALGWWLRSLAQLHRKGFREKQFYTEQFDRWVETAEDVEYSFKELLK
ncbi:SERTA domain-containing protein 3 [Marasmius crinis-equi]|uniref:SERTA domain-containing protein 3 n=1 Tax=Marasmius crinis-equi TaxID=585013 RepID=A0ABR3FAW5_9AGAR